MVVNEHARNAEGTGPVALQNELKYITMTACVHM